MKNKFIILISLLIITLSTQLSYAYMRCLLCGQFFESQPLWTEHAFAQHMDVMIALKARLENFHQNGRISQADAARFARMLELRQQLPLPLLGNPPLHDRVDLAVQPPFANPCEKTQAERQKALEAIEEQL